MCVEPERFVDEVATTVSAGVAEIEVDVASLLESNHWSKAWAIPGQGRTKTAGLNES